MLKALLGHWKANRKKPSLLPEDGDIHFDEPTTINPLFEDSDSSISSSQAAGANGALANDSQTDSSGAEFEQREEVDNLVDLAIPAASPTENGVETGDSGKETEVPSSNEVNHFAQDPTVDLGDNEALASEQSENSESPVIDEAPALNDSPSVDEENMRIYQPPPNVPSNSQESSSNVFASGRKETSIRLSPGKHITNENSNGEAKPAGILKNRDTKFIPAASKFSSNLLSANREQEHPANLRARAIDELIKRFQERSNGNEESDGKTDPGSAPSILGKNTKLTNGVTKAEQNGSSSSLALQTTEPSNKNSSQKESLINIFRVPPPPPLENLKQESRLHGKILAQASKAASPKASTSNDVRNVSNNTEKGTTRSDSSLERTRVASTRETNKSSTQATEPKRVDTPVNLESTDSRSFLHSTKSKDTIKSFKTESEAHRVQETVNRAKVADDAKKLESKTEYSKAMTSEHESEASKNSRSEESELSNRSASKTENAKADQSITQKSSPLVVLSDSPTVTVNPTVGKSKEEEQKTEDAQPTNERDVASTSKNSQPVLVETSVIQTKQETSKPSQEPKDELPPTQDSTSPTPSHKTVLKSSLSKASANSVVRGDPEASKSHSEDSGITRGDQISSEATPPDAPEDQQQKATPSPRKHKKNSKPKSGCKKCHRRGHGSFNKKRSPYDDYYDILTGVAKSRRSDSFASDLSWDERDLLQRLHALRSLRGTVRSTRSRMSSRREYGDSFRRFRPLRAASEDGVFLAPPPSLCSCDECWAQYAREYSYSRASLRGMSPVYMRCTCKPPRGNALGRRVKFVSDPILEVPLPEKLSRTSSSSASKSDLSKTDGDASDDKASKKSSDLKGSDSGGRDPDKPKKKMKFSEKEFRVMTPWELEQWDFLVRKELVRKRRSRARCMGLVALALVVFVGLVVTLLILFLKRRVL